MVDEDGGSDVSVLCSAQPPFAVEWVSRGWCELSGFSQAEALGKDLRCIQGPATDPEAVRRLMIAVQEQRARHEEEFVNYTAAGKPFRHRVVLTPIRAPEGCSVVLFRADSFDVNMLELERTQDETPTKRRRKASQPATVSPVRFELALPALSGHAQVLTQAAPPYAVLWASQEWLSLCGFSAAQVSAPPPPPRPRPRSSCTPSCSLRPLPAPPWSSRASRRRTPAAAGVGP